MNKHINKIYWTLLVIINTGVASAEQIQNPLGDVNTFEDLVVNLASAATQIAIPFVVIFLMYSGFLFVSARGNEKKLTEAKQVLQWTLIGAAVVVGAYALAQAATSFVREL